MTYPSIMTVWDSGRNAAAMTAAALARRFDAQLEIACLGVDRTPTGLYAVELAHEMAFDFYGQAQNEAETQAREARAFIAEQGLEATVRTSALRFGELPTIVARATWLQDLTVLSRPDDSEDEELATAILEAALFGASAPVLIAPQIPSAAFGRNIMVAWTETIEAMRALRAALPMLKAAERVEIAMVGSHRPEAGAPDPGAELGVMLSRHGVAASVARAPQAADSVADTLLARAAETEADMIVMGGYGHSRLRERLLGGVTRDMLARCAMPILMAH